MLIVCDIDGTLADISLRAKRAGSQPAKKNRVAFQMWLDRLQNNRTLARDKPIGEVVWLMKTLSKVKGIQLCYLTGRAEKYRKVTQNWLNRQKCPKAPLYMRPNDNYESARKFKEAKMLELVRESAVDNVIIFDDDGEGNCWRMYKKHGWCHLRVMRNV